ncbi:hypothetical protein G7Y89_g12287 [Cudoniella acicularis]|uniref:EamA domain-containing protein n=1 Tax=Cudoniella acicularis TaxID=354080 RepID=A0A8H4R9F1_9HELO|nr:hypothetical protein G7Y89_g12287 [Cudoniella acicularis]
MSPPPPPDLAIPQPSSTTKERFDESASLETDNFLSSLQNIPSNFDLALNGGTNRTFLSPNPSKTADSTTLLDPDTFRRLSISTISSLGGGNGNPPSRNASPYPIPIPIPPSSSQPLPFKTRLSTLLSSFWARNQGLFLVSFSQLFGALMNVTTRLLELEGEGMHPLQILFARMFLTTIFCCAWMWWKKVPDFPWGAKDSLQYLPVADAVVITFLAPSVASYACYLFLKEPFPRSAQYASLSIPTPSFVFSPSSQSQG